MDRVRKRDRNIDVVVFVVLLSAVSAITLTLFYRQTHGDNDIYYSDMRAYILEMQGLDSGYQFPYPVFFRLSALIHLAVASDWAVAIAAMLLNSLGIVVAKLALNHLVLSARGKEGAVPSWVVGVGVSLAAVSLFFLSMLYPPEDIYLPGIRLRYVGVFSPNPFHNATYMAARPFAILAFLWYVKLLPVYEEGLAENRKLRDYVLFSLFLLLATMTKPSFTLMLVSTAGLVMLYRLIRSGFRKLFPALQMGLCFLPTFANLLYQYQGVFTGEDGAERGIGLCFGEVWAQYCDNIPLAIGLAMGFPLLVLVLNMKECGKDVLFRFAGQLYLVGFAEAFLLYEKGFRRNDFNFSWGYMYGIFFCHFGALAFLLRRTVGGCAGGKRARMLMALQWLAYLWHLICGIGYFRDIFAGQSYW